MLKSLDILIGLSVVMLIVSMAVTLINQAILNVIAARGRCLRTGLADLLQLIDSTLVRQSADEIAAMVLTKPSIRKASFGDVIIDLFPSWQFGEVIHREEFTKILLAFGARQGELKKLLVDLQTAIDNNQNDATQSAVTTAVSALTLSIQSVTEVRSEHQDKLREILDGFGKATKQACQKILLKELNEVLAITLDPLEKILTTLKANGIDEPGNTIDNVRMMALQLEKSNPEQANDVRHSTALLQEASSPFLAKINFAFDQTMDRVSERYTYNTRIVTLFSAAILAIALQLDTVTILNRFAMDDKMRAAFVDQAVKLAQDKEVKRIVQPAVVPADNNTTPAKEITQPAEAVRATNSAKENQPAPAGKPAPAGDAANNKMEADLKLQNHYLNFLAEQGVIRLPSSYAEWKNQWPTVNKQGLLLSILLLSLGAPFWYNALGKLLQLRSVLARKDDDQKQIRQTTQTPETPAKPGSSTAPPLTAQGERGDLNAIV